MKKNACLMIAVAMSLFSFAAAKEKPNILLILSDDQSCDTVACYGRSPHAVSPNIDRLAEEGVLFEHAFANTPQCATSRLSLIMGKYCHHIGVYNFDKMHDDTEFYKPAFPTVLFDEQDYWNGIAGKDHTFFRFKDGKVKHGTKVPRFWEAAQRKSRNAPDRDFYIYTKDANGKTRIKRNVEPPPEEDDQYGILRAYTFMHPREKKIILAGYSDRGRGETMDDYILKDYRGMLAGRLAKDDGRPSFVDLSFVFPHTPVLPPEEVAKKFEKINLDVPEFSKEELESIKEHNPQMMGLIQKLKSYEMTHDEKLKTLQHYYAFCEYGDELVGKAVDDFKVFCEKQDRPWMIIYTSDQGWQMHEHGICGKFTMYDESVRVPMIIASSDTKAFPPGTRYSGMVELVDLAPTILTACGIDPHAKAHRENFDGIPLQELVSGKLPEKKYILCETGHVFGHWALYRTKEWAFSMKTRPKDLVYGEDMDWARRQSAEELDMMLFNLKNDPDEKRNLAVHPEYQQIRDEFRQKLEADVLGSDRIEYDWKNHPIPPFSPLIK